MVDNAARRVIARFGGQSALARKINKGQSVIAYWAKTGTIPANWHGPLLQLAAMDGVTLSPADFVDVPPPPAPDLGGLPIARYAGILSLGSADVSAYVLSDGQRVISRVSAATALSGVKQGGDLESYVGAESLRPFMRARLEDELIHFHLPGVEHKQVSGITSQAFLAICRGYHAAYNANALTTDRQREIALQAINFLAACAGVGLDALIDEATGYQYERADDALRIKFAAYLEEEMRPWEKTFPDELWEQFGRLTGWQGSIHNRPKYWGKLVNEMVYDCLDSDVYQWLKSNAPAPRHGQNYHQWLSSQYGLKKLVEHLWMLIGMASACQTMDELRHRMALKFGKQSVQLRLYIDPPN